MCYLIVISQLTATFLAFVKLNFFHLKNISKLRPMLSMSNAEMLIHAFMTSRLDYCNALLARCSARLINKLSGICKKWDPDANEQTIVVYLQDND